MSKRTFLEVQDLPKDTNRVFYKVRPALVRAFNTARSHPYKMTLLKETLKFLYNACVAYEKAQLEDKAFREENEKAHAERKAVLAEYEKAGIDADERKTTANLQAELPDLIKAKAAEAAK